MGILQKIWSLTLAIIPSWILTIPFFLFLNKKQEQVHLIKTFVDIFTGKSLLKDDEGAVDSELPKVLRQGRMPEHVAVILDGNRRWAKKRGLIPVAGYEAGFETIFGGFLSLCRRWKISIVSLFLFSTENWLRPQEEVDFLLELFGRAFSCLLRYCRKFGGRVSVIGDTSSLPDSLQTAIKEIEEETKDNTGIHLILAMSYSGQDDIVHACQSIATKVKDGLLQPEDITKSLFEQQLHTKVTDVPSPDLLIRTSGELRISNYYLWQSAYTEMYFTDTLWPDFGEDEFIKALTSFQQRGRRFGKE